mmetsp:Transcript_28237/g.70816  ORF Transcript_28237/g.70816 Transcript_28237/m.70816 type:complete len:479 (+) Transcript_28237:536-1972(+)
MEGADKLRSIAEEVVARLSLSWKRMLGSQIELDASAAPSAAPCSMSGKSGRPPSTPRCNRGRYSCLLSSEDGCGSTAPRGTSGSAVMASSGSALSSRAKAPREAKAFIGCSRGLRLPDCGESSPAAVAPSWASMAPRAASPVGDCNMPDKKPIALLLSISPAGVNRPGLPPGVGVRISPDAAALSCCSVTSILRLLLAPAERACLGAGFVPSSPMMRLRPARALSVADMGRDLVDGVVGVLAPVKPGTLEGVNRPGAASGAFSGMSGMSSGAGCVELGRAWRLRGLAEFGLPDCCGSRTSSLLCISELALAASITDARWVLSSSAAITVTTAAASRNEAMSFSLAWGLSAIRPSRLQRWRDGADWLNFRKAVRLVRAENNSLSSLKLRTLLPLLASTASCWQNAARALLSSSSPNHSPSMNTACSDGLPVSICRPNVSAASVAIAMTGDMVPPWSCLLRFSRLSACLRPIFLACTPWY